MKFKDRDGNIHITTNDARRIRIHLFDISIGRHWVFRKNSPRSTFNSICDAAWQASGLAAVINRVALMLMQLHQRSRRAISRCLSDFRGPACKRPF